MTELWIIIEWQLGLYFEREQSTAIGVASS